MQETRVWSLIQEDPTCLEVTKPVHRNSRACALEPGTCSYWSPKALEPVLSSRRSHCGERPSHCREEWPLLSAATESLRSNADLAQPKINKLKLLFFKVNLNTCIPPPNFQRFILYWGIASWQCCDRFRWLAKGLGRPYTCIHSLPPPSHPGWHITLSRGPRAAQEVLTGYPF